MAELTPAWTQDGSYAADRDRGVLSALLNARHFVDLAPQVTKVDAGGGHGVVGSGDLVVAAGAGHSVDVAAGQAIVRGTQQSGQGPYIVSNDAAKNVAIATPDATNGRIDLIQARVIDAAYSGTTGFSLNAKTGTPAASPAVPTPDENTLVLAEVLVPAGAASAASYTITDRRTRATAIGGTFVCATSAQYPNPASAGMRVYDVALSQELVHNGTAWVPVSVLGAWTAYTPALTSTGSAPTMLAANRTGRYVERGKMIEGWLRGKWTALGAGEGVGTGTYRFSLPVAAAGTYGAFDVLGFAGYQDSGTRQYVGVATFISTTTVEIDLDGGAAAGAATPVVPANNDFYHVSFQYERG